MKKIVILTGAGISAESGIKTFRDGDGLWETHRVEDVATPQAWVKDAELVLDFYNARRKQLFEVAPNSAHLALKKLEDKFDVQIITQNVDNLHERAGSSNVLHLHGLLTQARSTFDPSLIYDIGDKALKIGDKCERGSQLRPHIVWFGEAVPNIEPAAKIVSKANILMIIGTSLLVYPAAGLMYYAPVHSQKFYIDPSATDIPDVKNLTIVKEKAGTGVPRVVEQLLKGENGK
ncbi:MAG: NAD-dependent deacylase [Bacteroidales bacterium]|jgi:NAD-dependent deacetylase|nr:NAD-dependent deacylase [Bacteroidales bacterium]